LDNTCFIGGIFGKPVSEPKQLNKTAPQLTADNQ